MDELNLIKIKHPIASTICQLVELDEQARGLLKNNATPAQYVQQLLENELYPDAVRFLAHALPKREAIWWACLCARHALTEYSSAEETHALELAEAWVYKPTDENRKLTLSAAMSTQFNVPASWTAIAAFWSGGNISNQDSPVIQPAENATAKAVVGAVISAVTKAKPEAIKAEFQLFLRQGINIAGGGDGRLAQ